MKFNINFVDGAFCEILSNVDNKYNVQFIDKDTDKVIYDDVIKSNMWCKSSYTYFIQKWYANLETKWGGSFAYPTIHYSIESTKSLNGNAIR